MRFLALSLLLLLSFASKAQSDYTIDYTVVSGVEFDEKNNASYKSKQQGTLFINSDSLSFFKYGINEQHLEKILLKNNKSHHGILNFLKAGGTYENSTLFSKNYFIKHNWDEIINKNWEILDDTLTILGYMCTQAVNDSGIVAWFTDSISVSSGPMYYQGLPGIILQVNDGKRKQIITATLVRNESAAIVLPKKYKFIAKKDYFNLLEKNRPQSNFIIIK